MRDRIQVFEAIEQGTDIWKKVRCGIPTASAFASILAKGEGKTRRTYLLQLAGEILTGEPAQSYSNADMERGHEMEPAARSLYEFIYDAQVKQVGFVLSGRKGCSPDGLIGENGMLEIKTKKPAILIDTILRGVLPPEHKAQVQGQLWVAEREWVDFCAYWPGMPLFIHRSHRDEAFISELAQAVNRFNDELDEVVAKVRAYGEIAA